MVVCLGELRVTEREHAAVIQGVINQGPSMKVRIASREGFLPKKGTKTDGRDWYSSGYRRNLTAEARFCQEDRKSSPIMQTYRSQMING